MGEHTPTPWEFCKNRRRWAVYPMSARNDGIDYFVAEMQPVFADDESVEKANAELIVLAVNSYDALVKALQEAIGRLETVEADTGYQFDGDFTKPEDKLLTRLRAALSPTGEEGL